MIIIEKIYKTLEENINKIKFEYKYSKDLTFKYLKINNLNISLVYLSTLSSDDAINNYILKSLNDLIKTKKKLKYKNILTYFKSFIPGSNIKEENTFNKLYDLIENGFTCILFNNEDNFIAVETKKDLSRSIDTPKTEQTISGPKDSFTENYNVNIGLIRKRIKSKDLILEEFSIGNLTNTKVGILYMDNIVLEELLNEVRKKLNEINIDGIIDASYITEILSSKNIVFPLITETERPDLATMSLLEGKVLIAVDNSPYMVIIPTFFSDLFSAPEDYYQRSKNVTFTRIIRITAFLLAILLPAFFIAITTYNHETIPLTLIINFAAQRQGVPFPSIIEALLMILIFEILRESDIRMPSLGGSAISILGAIVLGDAAVSAGIVSPIMVIVVATSAMCSLMFSHISMVNAIRFWRIIFMLFATILGLPGLYFCIFLFVIYLSSLKSFGKPYLYPFAPFNFQGIKDTLFKQNIKNINKRNPLLTDKNITRSKNL